MSDLLKKRAYISPKKKEKKTANEIAYSTDGKLIRGKLSKGKRGFLILVIVFCTLGFIIYIPPMFYHEKEDNEEMPILADAAAIKDFKTYLKNNPDADFDGDGLTNIMESEHGTDLWEADSDSDGVSDYAELFVTETSPTEKSNIMIESVTEKDKKEGTSLGTPYKIDDVIFWPDTYKAKAYGGIVRTLHGYRFWNYEGWVKFPDKVAAYGYQDGKHYELKYREAEDAYKITNSDEIRIYDKKIDFSYYLKLPFIDEIHLKDGKLGNVLDFLLPDKGCLFQCNRVSELDMEQKKTGEVTAPLESPMINLDDQSRFGKNMNSLKDLSWLRKMIEAGECVAVSLYSPNSGEAVGIVYGYTENGSLLVANRDLKPCGTIKIVECAKRLMDKEGIIGQTSWYEWRGLGFDSAAYSDRISFFSSTIGNVEEISMEQEETEQIEKPMEEIKEEPKVEAGKETENTQSESEIAKESENKDEIIKSNETVQNEKKEDQPQSETDISEKNEDASGDKVITFGF